MVSATSISLGSVLIAVARAQQACSSTTETHPALTWSKCTTSGCTEVEGSVVVDANWRWTHTVDGSTNCYTGNEWDTSLCPDGETCAENCCVDGADYEGTYGVTTSGNQLSISFVTEGAYSTNIGSRLYLLEDESTYQMFTLLGNEFTFDVDVSDISCGLNGALYFVSMDEDGGLAKYSGNKAGAKYGTGYCDAQCARDVKFINGVGNVEDWEPSDTDSNSGTGSLGTCCPEMDIWEANDISNAFTAHPCETLTQHSCDGDECGGTYSSSRYAGDCDPDGCDFNAYRQGNESFYGPGSEFTVDTTQKMTVVTQFIEGSDGALSKIKRFYVQNDKVIANSESTISGASGNDINSDYCTAQKVAFGDEDDFSAKGGFSQMSDAIASPMVLVMSLWDDHHSNMLWLDSTYPANSTDPGATRGSCSTDSGVPADVEADSPDSKVVFSNIKFGPIGTTFDSTGTDTEDDTSSSSSSSAASTKTTTKTTAKATSTAVTQKSSTSAAVEVQVTTTSTTKSAVQSKSSTSIVPEAEATTSTASEAPITTSIVPVAESSSVKVVSSSAVVEDVTTTTMTTKTTKTTTVVPDVASTDAAAATPTDDDSDDSDCDDEDDDDSDSGSSTVAAHWYQCGGINWTGATTCEDGYTCTEQNAYYYQCV